MLIVLVKSSVLVKSFDPAINEEKMPSENNMDTTII